MFVVPMPNYTPYNISNGAEYSLLQVLHFQEVIDCRILPAGAGIFIRLPWGYPNPPPPKGFVNGKSTLLHDWRFTASQFALA
jgi:hypothetical protein